MSILTQLNSPFLYFVCGAIILFIAAVSLFFLIRAYRAGKASFSSRTRGFTLQTGRPLLSTRNL